MLNLLTNHRRRNSAPSAWPENDEVLRVSRRTNRCTVLGPGVRAVIWVQGCPLRCPGCVALETLPFQGGIELRVNDLVQELAAVPDIEGITISGGEPTEQSAPLVQLIDRLRAQRDLGVVAFSGHTIERLRAEGTPSQHALLDRIDLLIDGPYVQSRHTDLRWRGSDNQRLHLLSNRYEALRSTFDERGTALEFEHDADGAVQWMGIPPRQFRAAFEAEMRRRGILLQPQGANS